MNEGSVALSDYLTARLLLLSKTLHWRMYSTGIYAHGRYYLEYETWAQYDEEQFTGLQEMSDFINGLFVGTV